MKLDFLERDELERITCRKTAKAMVCRLIDMAIPYLLDGDGWPLVLRSNIDKFCNPKQETDLQSEIDKEFKNDLAHAFDHLKKRRA